MVKRNELRISAKWLRWLSALIVIEKKTCSAVALSSALLSASARSSLSSGWELGQGGLALVNVKTYQIKIQLTTTKECERHTQRIIMSWLTINCYLSWSCCNNQISVILYIKQNLWAKQETLSQCQPNLVKNPTKNLFGLFRSFQIHGNGLYCFGLGLEGVLQLAFAARGVVGQDSRMSTHHPLQQVSSLTNLDHAADKVFDTCPHRQTAHEKQRGQLHAVAWLHDGNFKEASTKTIITMKYSTRIYLLINIAYRLHLVGKPNSLQRLLQFDIDKLYTWIELRKEARFLVVFPDKLPELSAVWSWTSNFHLKTVHWLDWGQGLWMASSWNRTWPMARLQAHGVWRSMLLFENIFMVLMN